MHHDKLQVDQPRHFFIQMLNKNCESINKHIKSIKINKSHWDNVGATLQITNLEMTEKVITYRKTKNN